MRRAWAILLASTWACGGTGTTDEPVQASGARTLSVLSPDLPESTEEQALQALRQEAWRREHRFRDAADPGYLFRSTRISQDEVESGEWSPDELFQLGGQLFHLHFSRDVGFGGADLPLLGRFHLGKRGGPDAPRCASCHWRGGPAGAGDAADNAMLLSDGRSASLATPRNPPSLVGAGLREIVAREMTLELQTLRDDALDFAADAGYAVRIDLMAKGISFGHLTVHPDGDADANEVEGVDTDLVVRPFGWKGTFASVRDVAEDALNIHHGMQTSQIVAEGDELRIGSAGGDDPDGDGFTDEITEGQVSALTLYIAMREVPSEQLPEKSTMLLYWAEGRQDFDALGCIRCHTPSLTVDRPRFRLESRVGGPTYVVDMPTEAAQPRIVADDDGQYTVRMFSDLKRHAMGEAVAENRPLDGLAPDVFVTPPLWGIARSRPYLHDGSAPTLEDAVLAHGGEAQTRAMPSRPSTS